MCRRKFRLTRARSMPGSRDAKEIGIGWTPANSSSLITFISGESRFGEKGCEGVFSPFLEPDSERWKEIGERTRVNEQKLRTRRVEHEESSLLSCEYFPEEKTRTKCNERRPQSSPLQLVLRRFPPEACNFTSSRISSWIFVTWRKRIL